MGERWGYERGLGWAGSVRCEEGQDAALEFGGLVAESGGVERAGNDPHLFGTASGGVDALRVATGKSLVHFVADEKNRESARSDSFDGGNFRDGKSGEFLSAIEQRPTKWSEKRFTKPGILAKASIVVRSFAKAGEGSFGDDGFDARIGGGGLQSDARAHGFAESENMIGPPRRTVRPAGPAPLDRNAKNRVGRKQCVNDGAGVVAFEPAVSGDGAFTGAVSAGVHHDDTVASAEQYFGLAHDAHAVIGDTVEDNDPTAVGGFWADLPAAEHEAIGGADIEVFAVGADVGESVVGFADVGGRERFEDRMEEVWRDQPTSHAREERREEEQEKSDADESPAHVVAPQEDTSRSSTGFRVSEQRVVSSGE